MDNTYRRDSIDNQRNLFHSSPPNIEKPLIFKATIKTPLYLSVSEDRKCISTACPLVFLHFSHDTDMGKVDVDLLLRMLFVSFTAFMDDDLGYKGVQDFWR